MLDPNTRSLYTSALAPPPAYVFDQALATTFSLDLETLLTVPLHLLMLSARSKDSGQLDPVTALEGLRRVTDRISVYCQTGRIAPPTSPHVLYGLLESSVIEVKPPKRNGVFHPKLWVLRFTSEADGTPFLRVLVLSRNLTVDDSWDIVLSAEAVPGTQTVANNGELVELLRALPTAKLAVRPVPDADKARARLLAREVSRCEWSLPRGFTSLVFRTLGVSEGSWLPPRSSRLAVISPFCGERAIDRLTETTTRARALVSRPDELASLAPTTLEKFDNVYVIDDAVETEWAEDGTEERRSQRGLHAKVYVAEHDGDTTIAIGSANLTEAGLFGANVELVAELTGSRRAVGGVDDLLGSSGLEEVLVPYQPSESACPSAEELAAEAALETARRALANAPLQLACESADRGWRLVLHSDDRVSFDGLESVRAWPVSMDESDCVDAMGLSSAQPVVLGEYSLASVTGFLAFSMVTTGFRMKLEFVLNLPMTGMPEGREAALTRALIDNEGAFLRYIRLLLTQDFEIGLSAVGSDGTGTPWLFSEGLRLDELSLLEELTRSLGRDPARLKEVDRLVRELSSEEGGPSVVPPAFLRMWSAFRPLLEEV